METTPTEILPALQSSNDKKEDITLVSYPLLS